MADEINLTIDDVNVTVEGGCTILQAAAAADIDIPHLCYDESLGLEPTSSCRLCLVEVEGARAPVTACSHAADDGMVVRTQTEELIEMRKMVIDLLLSDHPHDCLTCEEAGRCRLQEYAYQLGVKSPEYAAAEAVSPNPVQDGPAIVYDRTKCILCGRCVQVCQDVQVDGAIDFQNRGDDTTVGLPAGMTRELSTCSQCGNCIGVCPTGAMSFAGQVGEGRTWDFERTATTCPYCGCGCTLVISKLNNRVVAVTGDRALGPCGGLLCVKGRFGLDFVGHEDRLTEPLIRRNGKLEPASWEEALSLVAERLGRIKAAGPDAIGGLSSAKCTNEENYIFQKFMRAVIGTNNVDHCARLCHASTVAGLARAFGSGAMTNSIEDFEKARAIFVIGSNTTECHPIIGSAIKRAAKRGVPLIVADPRRIELTRYAAVHMRQRSGTDVALVNAMMNVILAEGLEDKAFIAERTEDFDLLRKAVEPYTPERGQSITSVPAELIVRAARLYAQAQAASIVYSMGITQHATGTDNVLSLANLAMLTGNVGKEGAGVNPLRGQNNVQGACDLAALPNVLPGYQKVDDDELRGKFAAAWGAELPAKAGLTVCEMIDAACDGRLKAIYIMGENPMISDPDVNHVEESLKKLDFLVVQDIFLTETAQLADVVLPAVSFVEKDGTFTNTERRIQRVRRVLAAPGQARVDWSITCELARRMGYQMAYDDVSAIEDEIASLTPIYAGITYDRLEKGTLQWPCTGADHPGTPYLHKDRFTRGKGKFHAVEFLPPREMPDDEYPFVLSTGRMLEHFHTGSMSRRSDVLDKLVPLGAIEINPEDAQRLGVEDGQKVRVASRRGQVEIAARITDRVAPGSAFMAFHFREAPANRLTIAALDPIAKIPELKVCAVQITPV